MAKPIKYILQINVKLCYEKRLGKSEKAFIIDAAKAKLEKMARHGISARILRG